ncbi:MAG: M1 family metallopeptidase [Verrucomicrobiales bacterium]|nr:M1 family metallopeptidase [Verrucomicrobiales bacterium]MBT5846485.1 M1 family metallopeptidase [Verrucomicrobiales bacterium]
MLNSLSLFWRRFCAASLLATLSLSAAPKDPFKQLDDLWPTPDAARRASGAPGPGYWQQRADYVIDVELDEAKHRITGRETITYHNRSQDTLDYLWLQLDQNLLDPKMIAAQSRTAPGFSGLSFKKLDAMLLRRKFDGGHKITAVKDAAGKPLKYVVVQTMMRVIPPTPLKPGKSITFSVEWNYNINDTAKISGRTGYEYFKEDKNHLYAIAQWFPRMCAYTDVTGWQNKQYLGTGEFALEFGNYLVRITAPADHVVASTGVLQNADKILTKTQRARLAKARTAKKPVFIVNLAEAKANEKEKAKGKKTWVFKADNVRDFAFASSRKFLWDAMGVDLNGKKIMAMSYWPKEGEPLWSRYSTHAVAHTLELYSRYTFDYPYPVAISVNAPVGGMEYPMICWQRPRPEKDGTYSKRTKYGLISVIIHEVGHNWFPMIINSDERQWMWMDEGINSFLQFLTEQEWEADYPSRIMPARMGGLLSYLKSPNKMPIMTGADSLQSTGYNAYTKPTLALNILRESVLGREQFDYAFKQYARRWMFKSPTPTDFFRTMEDASGQDLDWFWRGWFYGIEHTDISIENVHHYKMDTRDPYKDKTAKKDKRDAEPDRLFQKLNQPLPKRVDAFPELKDFYNEFDELDVTEKDRASYEKLIKDLSEKDKAMLKRKGQFYVVDLKNLGGLVMPVAIKVTYEDKSTEEIRLPAQIWRRNPDSVSKMIVADKKITSIEIDPHRETADVDIENNYFPRRMREHTFGVSKSKPPSGNNPLRDKQKAEEKARKEAEEKKKKEAEKKPASKKK